MSNVVIVVVVVFTFKMFLRSLQCTRYLEVVVMLLSYINYHSGLISTFYNSMQRTQAGRHERVSTAVGGTSALSNTHKQ